MRLQKRGLYRDAVTGVGGLKHCCENRTEAYRVIDGLVKERWIVSKDIPVAADNLS